MNRFANLRRRLGMPHRTSISDDVAGGGPVVDVEFRIPNMVCEGCAEKVDGALHSLEGVLEIRSNVAQKRILVRYEPTKVRPEQIKNAVSQAGFTAVEA